ncbi:MAG: hypothetical protein IAF08_10660 [Rhizobacter sp.]|nr:hypothetical protein [Chlorobiales bacterium]
MNKFSAFCFAALLCTAALATTAFAQDKKLSDEKKMSDEKMMSKDAQVIELVQTPKEFTTKELTLKPGKYQFKITNKSVDHEVGFYLTEQKADGSDGQMVKGSNAGHPKKGESVMSGVVDLKAGKYNYSCPLNPTPHYTLTVR